MCGKKMAILKMVRKLLKPKNGSKILQNSRGMIKGSVSEAAIHMTDLMSTRKVIVSRGN